EWKVYAPGAVRLGVGGGRSTEQYKACAVVLVVGSYVADQLVLLVGDRNVPLRAPRVLGTARRSSRNDVDADALGEAGVDPAVVAFGTHAGELSSSGTDVRCSKGAPARPSSSR